MAERRKGPRSIAAPFVAPGPSGVTIRDRLKGLTPEDERVLRLVGEHLGALASRDLAVRCAARLDHDTQAWAARKRDLTAMSSSRWAGSITKTTHDQWALSRRAQAAHLDEKSREKHGRRKRFRQLINGIPTSRFKARLVSMAAEAGMVVVAVDPAYTSQWGAQHWQKPLTTRTRSTTRHDAASIAIGRRALGHPIRRRTTPPRQHQSDAGGHRNA